MQLIQNFQDRISSATDPKISKLKIHHIRDETLGLSRDVYHTARAEKDARAEEMSTVKRLLGRESIVIADGLNYIKGYRYQLFCEAKALQTPSCVVSSPETMTKVQELTVSEVHVGTPADECRKANRKRDPTERYSDEDFENLIFRYEEPNGMTRWDSPLFTVVYEDENPPFDRIWDAIIGSDGKTKVIRPNASTVLKPATEQDYLYELDNGTSDIVSAIQIWQKDHPGEDGGEVSVPEVPQKIQLPTSALSLSQLQRIRRQFIAMNRQHTLEKSRIRVLFVDYLNDTFEA